MKFTAAATLVALAGTTCATPIAGTIKYFTSSNATCAEVLVGTTDVGKSVADGLESVNLCKTLDTGYSKFTGVGLVPTITYDFYTAADCSATPLESSTCVTGALAYIIRREGFKFS